MLKQPIEFDANVIMTISNWIQSFSTSYSDAKSNKLIQLVSFLWCKNCISDEMLNCEHVYLSKYENKYIKSVLLFWIQKRNWLGWDLKDGKFCDCKIDDNSIN